MPNDPSKERSPHHPSRSQPSYDCVCTSCGTKFLAKSGAGCPSCGGNANRGSSEITKKVVDDNDLIK